jgi:hypothetical protein
MAVMQLSLYLKSSPDQEGKGDNLEMNEEDSITHTGEVFPLQEW